MKIILLPPLFILAKVFELVTILRNLLYDLKIFRIFRVDLPVVSVGNVTVGGNGKTPFCILLAGILKEMGYHPVILSRGYKGREQGPAIVNFFDKASEVGDEPLLLSRYDCVVVVAKDRLAGARYISERKLGNVIVLDDGFQHRRLYRDLDIVCIDVATEQAVKHVLNGQMLPLGRLREKLSSALKRADMIIFSCGTIVAESVKPANETIRGYINNIIGKLGIKVQNYPTLMIPLSIRSLLGERQLSPCKVVALSALAKPQNFYQTLQFMGYQIIKEYTFGDHHYFSEDDLTAAASHGVPVVCTEKDAVKILENFGGQLSEVYAQIYTLPVKMDFVDAASRSSFCEQVVSAIKNTQKHDR